MNGANRFLAIHLSVTSAYRDVDRGRADAEKAQRYPQISETVSAEGLVMVRTTPLQVGQCSKPYLPCLVRLSIDLPLVRYPYQSFGLIPLGVRFISALTRPVRISNYGGELHLPNMRLNPKPESAAVTGWRAPVEIS